MPPVHICNRETPWGCNIESIEKLVSIVWGHGISIHQPSTGFTLELPGHSRVEILHAQVDDLPTRTIDVNDLSLIMKLIFAFGLSFQLPVVLSLLARIGFVDSIFLKKRRKYVIVIIFIFAAFLTPPDPVTQIGLALPLLLLYEISILLVKMIEKRNA